MSNSQIDNFDNIKNEDSFSDNNEKLADIESFKCDCSCGSSCKSNNNSTQNNDSAKSIDGMSVKRKNKKALIIILSIVLTIILSIVLTGLIGGWHLLRIAFEFISNEILGMQWLNRLFNKLLLLIGGQQFVDSKWGSALQFFLYDTVKIIFLLCILIFGISYVQSYFPPERTKRLLGKHRGIGANIFGALLGTVTPFCSCSSIPIFMGFTRAGLSSGVTFSFLISSPLVDLGAFILLASVFGFPIAIVYVVVGLVLAVVSGTIIDKTGLGNYIQDYIKQGADVNSAELAMSQRERAVYAKDQMLTTLKKVWLYILIGVLIGATIHNFIPYEWIQAILGQDKWYSVIVASLVGVPMYADIFGTIPVAEALFFKGVGIGTILSFMMSVTALSLPSMIMLSKIVKKKLLVWFILIVVTGIIAIGYIFNAIGFLLV